MRDGKTRNAPFGTTARLGLFAAGSLLLFVPGCRPSVHKIISVIPRQSSENMWVTEHAGINEAAARSGVGIYWNGPTEDGDLEQQIVLATRAQLSGNMGLILSPDNAFALNSVVERSLERGMSVVVVGTPLSLKPEKRLSFVLSDVETTGILAAQRLRDRLDGRGEIILLGLDPNSPDSNDRAIAFEKALRRLAPGIRIADRLKGPSSFGQAELAAEKAILANPNLRAILSLNTLATRGAVAALNTAQVKRSVLIVGCDQTADLLYLLRRGSIDALVVQDMHTMGSLAVREVVAESRDERVPPYTMVQPKLVVRENIDEPAMQDMLSMDWRGKL